MWMAQGYFSVEQDEEVDIIGEEYFNILATHSFFQEFKKDDDNLIVACKMHDIVHDFAQFVSQNECSSMEINGSKEHNAINSLDKKVCHLMLIIGEGASFPVSTCRVKRMRSLFIGGNMLDNSSLNGKMLKELFEKLTSLRVLNIGKWSISRWYFILEIPRNIEKLIHLKYLNLSCLTSIRKLPEPLCELYNLEKLDISHCWYLKELPEGIGKLINMKHLLNERTDSLGRMPAGIARLTSLRTFDEFHVSRGKAVDGHKGYVDEAKRLELDRKEYLFNLKFWFDMKDEGGEMRKNEDDQLLLEALKPPLDLKELVIDS
ncbi:disease resistance protein RGA2-like [Citrus sinensis]|uniref:disease resistance protein RGA2-like n=1 Tax=Citrus clementina TaxID=85681 RepID=UPI000CED6247|nr:disease resistance protein RGA2-like [Citrus x clementina]XP_052296959.1 disease resistance protein RGA2-like [Citrus sinensis]